MGVGKLTLMDPDRVSLSNLDRQILYTEADVGEFKAQAAVRRLAAFNRHVRLRPLPRAFSDGGGEAAAGADLVLAAIDTLSSRLEINAPLSNPQTMPT